MTKGVVPHGDGWNARQYDQLANNLAIHDLLATVDEQSVIIKLLTDRVNGNQPSKPRSNTEPGAYDLGKKRT